jgi:hypothetical protein
MSIRRVPATKHTPNAVASRTRAAYPVGPDGIGLTPTDFATAYGYDPDAAIGATQTVAIVDAYNDPNIRSDLDTFDAEYGLPPETTSSFQVLGQDGSTTLPANDTTGWSGEEALDVETVRGVCHLCKIDLLEANSDSNASLVNAVTSAVRLHATEITNSYGGPEGKHKPSSATRAALEAPYNDPGVVVTASTGDDGWSSWDLVNDGIKSAESPNLPSSLPDVVSVGGTKLDLNANGSRHDERVWNNNGKADAAGNRAGQDMGATGGGCSVFYKAKGWQSHIADYAKTGCHTKRLAADVSADGDPQTGYDVYTSYKCGKPCHGAPAWEAIGGTSLSSPLIAAMWALAGGSGGVRYPSLSLYGHANQSAGSFYDVRKGGNSWCDKDPKCAAHTAAQVRHVRNPNALFFGGRVHVGTVDCAFRRHTSKAKRVTANHQCNASTGYDGPSGLGTPRGLSAFAPLGPAATIHDVLAPAGSASTFTERGSDPFPAGKLVKFTWAFGDGSSSTKAAPAHAYQTAGTYTISLTVTDNYGRSTTRTTTVTVASH